MAKINVLGSCVSRVSLLDGQASEHGIADKRLTLDYYLDKQNIVCAMLPPPFSRGEVSKMTDICMKEKYAFRSLQQNLNKDTLPLLLASDAEWVVVDCMDMHMAHAKYNGTVFATQAYEFFRTSLGQNMWDVDKVRWLEQPFVEWKKYVDAFWNQMVERYGADHIILNRFRCNEWYRDIGGVIREIPERFHADSHPLPRLNNALEKLETYIIEKYHPWVIDISKYFMGDENMWENLQGAHFEREFYRETFDAIKRIIFKDNINNDATDIGLLNRERRGVEEELALPFDIESGKYMLDYFYAKEDPLWLNVLDKLYLRIPKDRIVQTYLEKVNN